MIEAEGWKPGADGIYEKDGQRLAFTMYTNSGNKVRETLLQVATEQYRQIGVEVTPRTEAFEALSERVGKSKDPVYGDRGGHDYDAAILGWSQGVDPDAYGVWHSSQIKAGQNQVGYQNEVVDRAVEAGRTSCGQDERLAAYKDVQRPVEQGPAVQLRVRRQHAAVRQQEVPGRRSGAVPERPEQLPLERRAVVGQGLTEAPPAGPSPARRGEPLRTASS